MRDDDQVKIAARTFLEADEKPTPDSLEQAPGIWECPIVLEQVGFPDEDGVTEYALEISAGKPSAHAGAFPEEAEEWITVKAVTDLTMLIPPRFDLSPKHPYYGFRFLSAGMSGDTDRVIGDDGKIYPVSSPEELERLITDGVVSRVGSGTVVIESGDTERTDEDDTEDLRVRP